MAQIATEAGLLSRPVPSNSCVLLGSAERIEVVVVERDGLARKDTFLLGPNSEVEVFVKFEDYRARSSSTVTTWNTRTTR